MNDAAVMRDEGLPTEPGFYWTMRVGTKLVSHGTPQVVELRRTGDGDLWGDGFGDMELEEIGFAWQRVKPFDVESARLTSAPVDTVITRALTAGFERGDGSMDGAMQFAGGWWHPKFGSDSLQATLDWLRELREKSAT